MEIAPNRNLMPPELQQKSRKQDLHVEPTKKAKNVVHTSKRIDLIQYLHEVSFSTYPSTWTESIKNTILDRPNTRDSLKTLTQ